MNRNAFSLAALAAATLLAGSALAADASGPLTREQVRAQLAEAHRTGDIVVDVDTGLKLNQQYPDLFPKRAAAASTVSREQVRAELARASSRGEMVVDVDTGRTARQTWPDLYPQQPVMAQTRTRAEVRAELAEAERNGELVADVDTGVTYKQRYPQVYPLKARSIKPFSHTAQAAAAEATLASAQR